jgi:hypothetical protein
MSKKKVKDEEIDEEIEKESEDSESESDSEKSEDEESAEEEQSEISKISDDDDVDNLVIEIDESDLDIIDGEIPVKAEDLPGEEQDIVLSKHKIQGKHSLKYDSIFKGKKDDPIDEDGLDGMSMYYKESIEVDKSSNYYFESIDNEQYIRSKLVKERVYSILSQNTDLNFLNNRRKPSRVDFNNYYTLLRNDLQSESFTNVELFNELSVYFSDNLFNMFKLLDNKWRNLVISELQDHIGKTKTDREIKNRNIYIGTEIEFNWVDDSSEEKSITGVVVEADYQNSIFKVDSYENIYEVCLSSIIQILNNSKFKYNLNKLNNIDFL